MSKCALITAIASADVASETGLAVEFEETAAALAMSLTLAFAVTRLRTDGTDPWRTANSSGVNPAFDRAFTSAPASIKASTTAA